VRTIIVGGGKLGLYLASALSNGGSEVTVVANTSELQELGRDFIGQVVAGNSSDEDVLKKAGIQTAQAVVCVDEDEHLNIMVARMAKDIYRIPYVLLKIDDPEQEEFYTMQGLRVICPLKLECERAFTILAEKN